MPLPLLLLKLPKYPPHPLPQLPPPTRRDEYGDVVVFDIDEEDENDEDEAGQEDDPLGQYCQRID